MAGKLARRTQAERRATTRVELLDAAERVIAERGFEAASLAEIAEAAKLSKGAVYHHFASKDDLLLALLEDRFAARVEAGSRITETDPVEAVGRSPQEIPFDRRGNLLFLEFVVRAARDEDFREKFRERLERLRTDSTQGVQAVIDSQELAPSLSAEEIAIGIGALGNGLAMEGLTKPGYSTDALYAALLALLIRGIEAEAEARRR